MDEGVIAVLLGDLDGAGFEAEQRGRVDDRAERVAQLLEGGAILRLLGWESSAQAGQERNGKQQGANTAHAFHNTLPAGIGSVCRMDWQALT